MALRHEAGVRAEEDVHRDDREGDVALLARHFCAEVGRANGGPNAALDAGAVEELCGARWPGNVRQLRNVIERTRSSTPSRARRTTTRSPRASWESADARSTTSYASTPSRLMQGTLGAP